MAEVESNVYTSIRQRVEEATRELRKSLEMKEESKMRFLVEISYFRFEFDNYEEAITFMNLAKKSYLEDRKISMTVTYVEEEDDEDEV